MGMESGPKSNVVQFESKEVGAARRYSTAQILELKDEVNAELDKLRSRLSPEAKMEFNREAFVLRDKIESDTKQVQNNFLANILNAQNIKNEVERTKRTLFLHNNLHSHLIFIRTNITSKFFEKWNRTGEEPLQLAA